MTSNDLMNEMCVALLYNVISSSITIVMIIIITSSSMISTPRNVSIIVTAIVTAIEYPL